MSEKKAKKSSALPSHADWNLDADDKFLRRFKRLVRSAPAHALQRMGTYLRAVIEESSFPPGPVNAVDPTVGLTSNYANGAPRAIELAPETF